MKNLFFKTLSMIIISNLCIAYVYGAIPKFEEYTSLDERLETFKGKYPCSTNRWFCSIKKRWAHSTVTPDKLAEAGFFHPESSKDDTVKCFFCGVTLHGWEKNDSPWVEHNKLYSECEFLKNNWKAAESAGTVLKDDREFVTELLTLDFSNTRYKLHYVKRNELEKIKFLGMIKREPKGHYDDNLEIDIDKQDTKNGFFKYIADWVDGNTPKGYID